MPVSLKTQVNRTAKTPVTARRARAGGLCGFPDTAERVPAGSHKTGRCAGVRECLAELQHRSRSACGRLSAEEKPQAARQPAMDLSRDKNAEEMKWSPLEMGAAKQAHGA